MKSIDTHGHLEQMQSFSAGIFGFAATLLILNITIPPVLQPSTRSIEALFHEWPKFVIFVVTFISIGQVWISHRRMFACFRAADHWVLWLNVLLLLDVVSLPFFTGLLGAWARDPALGVIAAVGYGLAWAVGGIIYNAIWWYGLRNAAQLMRDDVSPSARRRLSLRWAVGPVFYSICALLALFSFKVAAAGFMVIQIFYIIPHRDLDA